jgi:spermidine synthase
VCARLRRLVTPTTAPVAAGLAELVPDADSDDGWWLSVDGVPQSFVDTADPTHLEFEYVRMIGDVLDVLPPGPLAAVHLGGGGCTLPRYVAATRPGSRQLVLEYDAALAALVREQLGCDGFKLRVAEAREGLAALRPQEADVVVGDVFVGAALPVGLTTVEFATEVRAVLRPGGCYVANLADGGGLAFARSQVATLQEVWRHVVVLGEPGVMRGRRFGNVVVAASDVELDVLALRRRSARAIGTARVLAGPDTDAFRGGARPVTDATAGPTPVPPPEVFVR